MTEEQLEDYTNRSLLIDFTSVFDVALADLNSRGGGFLLLPPGTARVDGVINNSYNNVGIIGSGRATRIAPTSPTLDVFIVGDGVTEVSGQVYRDFKIWPTVQKFAGYAFNLRLITDSRWDNVDPGTLDDYVANSSTHRMFGGWYFNGFDNVQINGGDCTVSDGGIVARGNGAYLSELTITGNLRIAKCLGKAIYIGGSAGGVYLGRINISECRWGVWCDSVLSGAINREIFLESGLIIDTCSGWGLYFGSNSVAKLEANGFWIGACGNSSTGEGGISVQPGAALNARWTGIRVQNSYSDGIQLNDGTHSFVGGYINNNGLAAAGGRGIYVANTGIDHLTIVGVTINNNGNGTLGEGITLVAGANNYIITNNNFFGNGTLAINNSNAPSETRVIKQNKGWITETEGNASGTTDGSGDLIVTHGMSVTPTKVSASVLGVPAIIITGFHTLTSTTFKVRLFNGAVAGAPALTAFGVANMAWTASI